MRHAGAWDRDSKKAYLNGPIVKPDKYIAELIIGNDVKRKDFTIKIDPKVIIIEDYSLIKLKRFFGLYFISTILLVLVY